MRKILFCDIDGTILSHRTGEIPSSTIHALQKLKENNILLVGCTGRHPLELQNLPLDGFQPDGWIVMNGAYCYDGDGEIAKYPIHQNDINILLDFLKEHPFPIQFMEKDLIYMNMYSDAVIEGLATIHTEPDPIMDVERARTRDIFMVIPWVQEEIWSKVSVKFEAIKGVRWNDYAVDCFAKECGKDVGIQNVLEKYHIYNENAYAIGDGENDIAMFQVCGTSVAMGNANRNVKKYATYVTDDIDEDGFYHALLQCGLIQE